MTPSPAHSASSGKLLLSQEVTPAASSQLAEETTSPFFLYKEKGMPYKKKALANIWIDGRGKLEPLSDNANKQPSGGKEGSARKWS